MEERKREYEQAIDSYNKAFEYKPEEKAKYDSHVQDLLNIYRVISKLDAKYNSGLYKETIAEYKDLIKKNDKVSDYYLGTAKCYSRLNDYSKALKNYKLAIEKDGNNLEAIELEADLYKRNKDLFNSLGDYNTYLAINKNNSAIYDSTSKLYLLINNDQNKAIQVLSDGITHNAKAAILYLERGSLLLEKRNFKQADNDFSTSIELDSNSAYAYYQRGRNRLSMSQVSRAAEDFEMARQKGLIATYTDNIQRFANEIFDQAAQKASRSEMDSAIFYVDKAISLYPSSATYRFTRGEYYYSIQNYMEAVNSYEVAVKLNSRYADAYYKEAYLIITWENLRSLLMILFLRSRSTLNILSQKGAGIPILR